MTTDPAAHAGIRAPSHTHRAHPELSGKRSTHARGTQLVRTKPSDFNGVAFHHVALAPKPTPPRRRDLHHARRHRWYMGYIESCRVRFPALPPERLRPARTTHDSIGRNRQVHGNGVRMTPLKKQNTLLKSLRVLPNAPQLPLHVTVPARTAHDATRQGNTAHRTPHGLSAERKERSGTARRQLPPRRRDLASGTAKTVHPGVPP
ncbi:hypothetical protein B0H14DRAFT_3861835 [Mycena olivaceomarginata]|nr:hypothetical protein B0H14DRAFT_3861835 [Mycena olivaceomarginata]